jgi:hypothetical protein
MFHIFVKFNFKFKILIFLKLNIANEIFQTSNANPHILSVFETMYGVRYS